MDAGSALDFYRRAFAGSWLTQGIWVAAELGIADLLADGPRTVEELAQQTDTHCAPLHRVLRALASEGVFAEDEQGRFAMTPLADPLRSGGPGSQRAIAAMMGAEFHETWGQLLHSVRTGRPGFNHRFGMPFFDYMTKHPDRHHLYDQAMTGVHGRETEPMLDVYDFASFRTVVDIGGGNGSVLAAILDRHSALQGVLFDLPAVAERARTAMAESRVSDRLRVEGGDFFVSVPLGGDAYVLRHIIHDWEDRDAVSILRRCQEAMRPEGRILVIEMVIPPGNEPNYGKWLDLMMLLVAGRERTREEYGLLFSAAGLKLNRVIPMTAEVSIMEGMRLA